MEKNENSHFIDKIVEALRRAAIEMEELQVQAAIGKAEAEDKYEEVKKKFNSFVHESKFRLKIGQEKARELHMKFDKLMVQLALGKAETIEAFKKQKKELLLTLHEIEVKIKTNEKLNKIYAFILIEIEKFKVQLDLLEQKYETGRAGVKEAFEKGKLEFNQFVDKLKSKYSKKKKETRWEHFQNEISEAFIHFKDAFVMPQH